MRFVKRELSECQTANTVALKCQSLQCCEYATRRQCDWPKSHCGALHDSKTKINWLKIWTILVRAGLSKHWVATPSHCTVSILSQLLPIFCSYGFSWGKNSEGYWEECCHVCCSLAIVHACNVSMKLFIKDSTSVVTATAVLQGLMASIFISLSPVATTIKTDVTEVTSSTKHCFGGMAM